MRHGSAQDSRKDDALRPILVAHSEDGDQRWRTILLVFFWPGLASIHRHKRVWDPDPEELWQNIVWTFIQVVCRIDPDQRPYRLAQKIYNNTVHRLHDEYRRRWDRARCEEGVPDERLEILAGGVEGVDLDGIALREAQEEEIRRLRRDLAEGLITEPDFYLMVGCRVYGQPLRDCAAKLGIAYEVAKKRRQRVEARLGPWEVNR